MPITMGDSAPTTLRLLAIEALLEREDLAISALETMPLTLLPTVFELAFKNGETNVLRAIVPIWPLASLPVGDLMEAPELETLKALLDGLDVFMTQPACPRKGKLRELDLMTTNTHFWSICAGTYQGDSSQQITRQKQRVQTCPDSEMKKTLKVVTELRVVDNDTKEYAMYLVDWAQQRKDSIHLLCLKLQIWESSINDVRKILNNIDLHSVQELHVCYLWIDDMAAFGPYLGQMRNLHTLVLEGITNTYRMDECEGLEEEWTNTLLSQFPKLQCLQHLYVNDIYLLVGCMRGWLGKGKLRELDLMTTNTHFWSICAGTYQGDSSQQITRQKQRVQTCPDSEMKKKTLKVVTELRVVDNDTKEYAMYLVDWAQQRKDSIHLLCLKLQIWESSINDVRTILNNIDLHSVQELHVCYLWIDDMAAFGPYLGQMRNLHTLVLEGITNTYRMDECEGLEEEWTNTLLSQFPKLQCLQHLYVNDIYLLVGCMRGWLGRSYQSIVCSAAFEERGTVPFGKIAYCQQSMQGHLVARYLLFATVKVNSICRKGKLRELDLMTTNTHFWSICAGTYQGDSSQQITRQKQRVQTCPDSEMKKKTLKVVTELRVVDNDTKEYAMYLVDWAQQRKDSIHLLCLKLQIWESSINDVRTILNNIDLHSVQELHVCYLWIDDMAAFGPYLGQMRNLHTLVLEGITNTYRMDECEGLEEEWTNTLLSQFPKLQCLQHLYVNDIYLLVGCMRGWLG
ncbi:hypothetical protein STEG23_013449 [Scotinomys teguina]